MHPLRFALSMLLAVATGSCSSGNANSGDGGSHLHSDGGGQDGGAKSDSGSPNDAPFNDGNACNGSPPMCPDACSTSGTIPAVCNFGEWQCEVPRCALQDAGLVDAGQAEEGSVPLMHRASAMACPTARGSEAPVCPAADGGQNALGKCTVDSQCDGGMNGRCLEGSPAICLSACSYDTCTMDSDCPALAPCICRASGASFAPNQCLVGSNCRTDSDCGDHGYCSPSPGTGLSCAVTGYFCHTPNDQCVNDTDCGGNSECVYSTQTSLWECASPCTPPP